VQKDGIHFGRIQWFSPDLREAVVLPPRWRGRPLRLELRYDAAALSRNMLERVVLLVRDEHDAVIKRVVCVPREEARRTFDREEQHEATQRFNAKLDAERAMAEALWVTEMAGAGAGVRHTALQGALKRQRRAPRRGMSPGVAPAAPTPVGPPAVVPLTKPRRSATKTATGRTSTRSSAGAVPAAGGRTGVAGPRKHGDALDAVAQQFLAADAKRRKQPASGSQKP